MLRPLVLTVKSFLCSFGLNVSRPQELVNRMHIIRFALAALLAARAYSLLSRQRAPLRSSHIHL